MGQTRADGLGGNMEGRTGHCARSCTWLGREVARGMDHFYLKQGLALYSCSPGCPGTHFGPLHQPLK